MQRTEEKSTTVMVNNLRSHEQAELWNMSNNLRGCASHVSGCMTCPEGRDTCGFILMSH